MTANDRRPRSCWIEIDLDALCHNLAVVRDELPEDIKPLCVVKADAYGHGAEVISKELEREGVDFFGVATLEEAQKLRNCGVESDILIMGHMPTFVADQIIEQDLTPMVYSFRLLKAINEQAKKRNTIHPIHLKVDTGMGRLGLLESDVPNFLDELSRNDHVRLAGVATHLAVAGEDSHYTRKQVEQFHSVKEMIKDSDCSPDHWHGMNSAAVFSQQPPFGTLARPGITLYGYPPHDEVTVPELKPVMQVKSLMADYKQVPPNHGVSYGRQFSPDKPTWIGVLPVGYADGYSRQFSNVSYVLKNNEEKPVLGAVCMDMTIIKLEKYDDPEEVVTLMGKDGDQTLWADTLAQWQDTITYEVLSGFSPRFPRKYYRENEQIALKTEHGVQFQ
ncbi:MAG: alanine racemase [bacterium]